MASGPKPATVVRDVSVYLTDDDEFMIERSDGSMSIALTSKDALALVRRDDAAISKRRRAVVITRVTWQPAFRVTKADRNGQVKP